MRLAVFIGSIMAQNDRACIRYYALVYMYLKNHNSTSHG